MKLGVDMESLQGGVHILCVQVVPKEILLGKEQVERSLCSCFPTKMSQGASRQTLLLESQCAQVYAHLDSRRPQAALEEAFRVLSLPPSSSAHTLTPWDVALRHPLAEALKALSLARLNRRKLALESADRLAEQWLWKSEEEGMCTESSRVKTALAVANTYQGYHLFPEAAAVFEKTFNAASATGSWSEFKEELGQQTFEALLLAKKYKNAQQVSLKLYTATSRRQPASKAGSGPRKKDPNEFYFWWSMTCYVIAVSDALIHCAA